LNGLLPEMNVVSGFWELSEMLESLLLIGQSIKFVSPLTQLIISFSVELLTRVIVTIILRQSIGRILAIVIIFVDLFSFVRELFLKR
jgi:hypothetical protein